MMDNRLEMLPMAENTTLSTTRITTACCILRPVARSQQENIQQLPNYLGK
jgi:hypothetical protein